ncbi:Serine/threonine-protein kinase tel1 [Tilletia horrida]|uniref:Serine/threonine-protein kinase Tel1 n=1 Tax=Tilletia horrida TaxID=155126 RepID=A0AAN6GGG3_9BASI|nr:Serine/threonine-protein kinase tel1 [Tilletia horrida]
MAPSLKKMWALLEGSTARDRQDGITMLRTTFAVKRNLLHIAQHNKIAKAEGRTDLFLRTVTALTNCVSADKQAVLRKHTRWQDAGATALSRLRDSAHAVRWLVEQANTFFNQPCLQTLVMHIFTIINDRGALFEPIALDYTKALSALLSHPPHVQHLTADLWSHSVAFCFNAILGDKLNAPLPSQLEDEHWTQPSLLSAKDSESDSASNSRPHPTVPRKDAGPEILSLVSSLAGLVSSKSAPLLTDKRGVGVLYRLATFFEVFPSPTSAHAEAIRCANAVLLDLHLNERRTTMLFVGRVWHTIIPFLPTRLKPLKEQVISFAIIGLPILASPYLAAPSAGAQDEDETNSRKINATKLLHQLLIAESQSRGGVEELACESLRLTIANASAEVQSYRISPALSTSTAQCARHWSAQNTLSWASLQLLADTTAYLTCWALHDMAAMDSYEDGGENEAQLEEQVQPSSKKLGKRPERSADLDRFSPVKRSPSAPSAMSDHSSPRKRRRMNDGHSELPSASMPSGLVANEAPYDALNALLDELEVRQTDLVAISLKRRTWALQSILFLAERHWSGLDEHARIDILVALHGQLDMPIDHTQPSLLLALAACAVAEGARPSAKRTKVHQDFWMQVWTETLRKAVLASTGRTAAHAAVALLHGGAPLLNSQKTLGSLKVFLANLETESPVVFADSTCALMREALRHIGSDVVLAQANFEFRVLEWVNRSWSTLSGSSRRSKMQNGFEELDAVDLNLLLIRVCKLKEQGHLIRPDPVMENCDLYESICTMEQLRTARAFLFEAKFPRDDQADAAHQSKSRSGREQASASEAQQPLLPIHRRCYELFLQSANDLLAQIGPEHVENADFDPSVDSPLPRLSIEDALRLLHFCIAALIFNSNLEVSGVRSAVTLAEVAGKLFVDFLRVVQEPYWSTPEKLLLFQALRPLFPPPSPRLSQQGAEWISDVLVNVGEQSGVSRDLLAQADHQQAPHPARILPTLWGSSSMDTGAVLTILQTALADLVSATVKKAISSEGEKLTGFDNEDEAEQEEAATAHQLEETAQLPTEMRLAFEGGVAFCVEAIAILPFFGNLDGDRAAELWLVQRLLMIPDAFFPILAASVLDAVSAGRLHLTHEEANAILTKIGSELLATYEYARVPEVQVLGSSFIQATMGLWQVPVAHDEEIDLAANTIEFFGFFTGQATRIRSWRVRLHLIGLFCKFLEADPTQDSWADADNSSVLPLEALIAFASDPDYTVRCAAAKAHAVVIRRLQDTGHDVLGIFASARERMTMEFAENFELTASLLLFAANVTISSSVCRAVAITKIAEVAWDAKRYRQLGRNTLEQVASKLGFPDAKELFKHFASNVTYEFLKSDGDPLNVDVQMLGYDSRADYSQHLVTELGSSLLLSPLPAGQTHFDSHVKVSKLELGTVLAACFPRVAAHRLIWAVQTLQGKNKEAQLYNKAWKQARDVLALDMRMQPADVSRVLVQYFHEVVAAILKMLFDGERQLVAAIAQIDPACADVLSELEAPLDSPHLWYLHEPYAPHAQGAVLYGALATLNVALTGDGNSQLQRFNEPEVYNPMHILLETINQDRFVNDQLRHLEALKLWIAFNHASITESPTLHGAILHAAAVIMQKEELTGSAVGLFMWCLQLVQDQIVTPTSQLDDDLLLAAHAAVRMSLHREDARTQKFGVGLITLLEQSMLGLYESSVQKQIVRALCAWPQRLDSKLAAVLQDMSLDETRSALLKRKGRRIEAHHLDVFTAKLEASEESGAAQREAFAETDFWQLLVLIGEAQHDRILQPREALSTAALGDSIADLIHALDGRISAPSLTALNNMSELPLLWAGPHHPAPHQLAELGVSKLKEITLGRLLRDLHASDSASMSSAYHKLQRLKLADPNPERFRARQDDAFSAELQILAARADYAPREAEHPDTHPDPSIAAHFDVWIKGLSGSVIFQLAKVYDDAFLLECCDIVATDAKLATDLIPVATFTVMAVHLAGKAEPSVAQDLAAHFHAVLSSDQATERSWSTIIQCLLTCRANSAFANDFGFHPDLLLVARRALACKLYSTALMFVELSIDATSLEARSKGADGKLLPPQPPAPIPCEVAEILHEIYANIDDPDGFYGIPIADVQEAYARQLQHEGEWRRALDVHATRFEADLQFQGNNGSSHGVGPVKNALHQLSYNGLASMLHHSTATIANAAMAINSTDGPEDPSFDIAWRMGQWDLPIEVTNERMYPGHGMWSALRALCRETDATAAEHTIATMASKDVMRLEELGLESYALGRELCRNLLSYREIRALQLQRAKGSIAEAAARLQMQWSDAGSRNYDYEDVERICAVRHAIVRMERERLQADQIGDLADTSLGAVLNLEASVLLHSSEASRKHGNLQKAMSAVTLARRVRSSLATDLNDFAIREEQACVLWDENSHTTAMQALSQCLSAPPAASKGEERRIMQKKTAMALARLGTWIATARAESAEKITQQYFVPAIETIQASGKDSKEHGKIAFDFAVFADAQYRHFATSPEHHRVRRFVERRTEELAMNEQETQRCRNNDQKKTLYLHKKKTERQLAADKAQLAAFETTCTLFLGKALSMYATSLHCTEEHNEAIFPFSSLWFENSTDVKANSELSAFLELIPSHKFIPLTHQLSARLSPGTSATQGQAFTTNLTNLLSRMCFEHPFHTMYAIFALRKAGYDIERSQATRSSPAPSVSSQVTRAKAAELIWRRIRTQPALQMRIDAFEKVCLAYVDWAEFNLKDELKTGSGGFRRGPHRIPSGSKLLSLRNVGVPVATKQLPIDVTGQYQGFVAIQRYSEMFSTAGGLHLPKINECIGTDGRRYKQLFKQEDDLRQDAVIQQVFRLVNDLLTKDRKTRDRRLHVRGYIVLPLGPQCGLLEFVPNTKPLGEVLTSLHDKYRLQGDLSANDTKQRLTRARDKKPEDRITAYKEACQQFPPAMRYHFLEAQKVPAAWQVMRLSYVRSVATTSIVGHILGMGDRHVSNILMDEGSGEMVHIDFGIVFEQGKLLPVPELVPFRLTRDLVDGMGIFGVEGSFRHCCQETLRVMRDGAETIKTVLEVFKYDPLFEWMMNPIKLLKAQANQDEESNMDALRNSAVGGAASALSTGGGQQGSGQQDTAELSADYAVSTVMGKLSKTLSVEHTVNDLIQQARNVDFLGAIYFGWSAHL